MGFIFETYFKDIEWILNEVNSWMLKNVKKTTSYESEKII